MLGYCLVRLMTGVYRIGYGAGPEVPDDALSGHHTSTCPWDSHSRAITKFGVVRNNSWPKVNFLSSFTSMAILATAHGQTGNSSGQRTLAASSVPEPG